MKQKIASLIAVPLVLVLVGIISYLTILNDWSIEITSFSVFLFNLAYILFLENTIPLKQVWKPEKKLLWADIKHFIFSTAIFDALGKMAALTLIIYIQKHFFTIAGFWDSLPFIVTYVIANLIGEFFPYVYHRVSHKGGTNSYLSLFLWKIHSIHHLPTSLNWFKTNWIHPINMFLNTLLKITPVILFGFSEEIIFLVGITHVVVAYISHANIQTKKSFLDYVIVTPQVHHFHHSINMEEAKNFGNIFPFLDLLFGTYYNRTGAVEKVGIIEESGTNYPEKRTYYKQLKFPITTMKDCCRTTI